MVYGYARVSTKKQLIEGNGMEEQEKKLRDNGCAEVIKEQFTGTTTSRPELDALVARLQSGDVLMVTKLDRLARTAGDGNRLITELTRRGIRVHILNMGMVDSETASGRLMLNVLLAFAEFERDLIVERTQAGREVARTHAGYREGRRPLPQARKDAAVSMIMKGHSYKEACAATGLSRSTILRAVQAERVAGRIVVNE